jgi:hypothetical protein
MSSGKKFDLESAVKTFPRNVRPKENLLKAKIVSIAFIPPIRNNCREHSTNFVLS